MDQKLVPTVRAEIDWDHKLTQPFPLAPRHLLVDAESYRLANVRFGRDFCGRLMREQISHLPKTGEIQILGAGLCRDLGWIKFAARKGFRIKIWDKSPIAFANARQFVKFHGLTRRVQVVQAEVMSALEKGKVINEATVGIFASQFIEHQGEALGVLMQHLGKFLRSPGRRVWIVLPPFEDNPPDTVKWESTEPPNAVEWQMPLKDAIEGPVDIRDRGKCLFFDRTYRFYEISS